MANRSVEMIVAVDKNYGIGKDGHLVFRNGEDMEHFKNVTMGKTIVMGRKSHEEIGRPLPGRRNVVLTKDRNWSREGVDVFHSVEEVLIECVDIMVIGGGEIYAQFMPYADKIHLTYVEHVYDCDVFFPSIGLWQIADSVKGNMTADNVPKYTFFTLLPPVQAAS